MRRVSRFLKSALIFSSIAGIVSSASADTVTIPFDHSGLPASDLVYKDGRSRTRILNPKEAWQLQKSQKLDLSTLDPDSSGDVWKKSSTAKDDALDDTLPIQEGDTVTFLGFITSSAGRFRFNIQVQSGNQPPRTLTVLLGRDTHTILLRKGLLRRLGYQVPAMKHLSRLNVILPSTEMRDNVFPAAIKSAAERDNKRWMITPPAMLNPLAISLQDIVVMEATPLYYNVAMSPPIELSPNGQIRPAGLRIIRSLGVIYGLANLPEDMNLSQWFVGHKQDGALVYDVTDRGNFACTIDDAIWILRRIAALTREDFQSIVDKAYVPPVVAKVMVENLIARRDSLLQTFQPYAANLGPSLDFKQNISDGKQLVDGRLADQDWQALGYGSYFAGKEQPSPLREIWWYVISQVQSNVTSNLLTAINNKLPGITTDDVVNKHNTDLYNQAMQQYQNTGTVQSLHFGSWHAPVIYGGIDVSRDIVIGSYMGTSGDNGANNIVQLADNFGFHVNAGFYIGFDGLPTNPLPISLQGQILGTASIEVTHLKPVTSLKGAVKEPLKEEFVPWVFYNAANVFKSVSQVQGGTSQTPADLKAKLNDDMKKLDEFIGEGESLILTETLSATEGVSAGVQVGSGKVSSSVGIQPSLNQVVLWRLRFYRPKGAGNTLLVFKDKGSLDGVQISLNASVGSTASFPMLQVTAKGVAGTADSDVYRLNINPDPTNNPAIYSNSASLVSALRTGSVEAIQSAQKPTHIETKFHDDSGWLQFLYYVSRSLRADGVTTITTPSGVTDTFLMVTDGKQSGGSYQSLFTQAVNFAIEKWKKDPNLNFDTKAAPNPGQTFKGYSQTRNISVQARQNNNQLSEHFGKIEYRREGWEITPADMTALTDELSARYGFALYPADFLHDATLLQLYALSFNIKFYPRAMSKLFSMSKHDKDKLIEKYNGIYHCNVRNVGDMMQNEDELPDPKPCYAMKRFEAGYEAYHPEDQGWLRNLISILQVSNDAVQFGDFMNSYWKKSANTVLQGEAIIEILSDLEQFVTFPDLVALTGGMNGSGQPLNLCAQATVTGFRVGSETLSDALTSNSYGCVDPDQSSGPLDQAEQLLQIDDGEFGAQWLRDHL